jgi:hypothetical protein
MCLKAERTKSTKMEKNNSHRKRLVVLNVFAIAMAFLEAAVVVYLRRLYYPEGFLFPLKMIPIEIYAVELGREAATIIMLAAMGWFSAKSFLGRFAGFMIAFGVWDIFYYLFLKITIDWPSTILDWDLLFLIPLPWLGPVIAPVIVSLFLISVGIIIWLRESQQKPLFYSIWHWILQGFAFLLIIGSFLTNTEAMVNQAMPTPFRWDIFIMGFVLWAGVFLHVIEE